MTRMSDRRALLEVIGQLEVCKGKADYYHILTFISQMMVDENEGRFSGAKVIREFMTKGIKIRVQYGE